MGSCCTVSLADATARRRRTLGIDNEHMNANTSELPKKPEEDAASDRDDEVSPRPQAVNSGFVSGDDGKVHVRGRSGAAMRLQTSARNQQDLASSHKEGQISNHSGTLNLGPMQSGLPLTPTPPTVPTRGNSKDVAAHNTLVKLQDLSLLQPRPQSAGTDNGLGVISPVSHESSTPVARLDPHRPAEGEEVALLRGGHETLFMESGSEAQPTDALNNTIASMTSISRPPLLPHSANPLLSPLGRGETAEDEIDGPLSSPIDVAAPSIPTPPKGDRSDTAVWRPKPLKATALATEVPSSQGGHQLPPLSPLAVRAPSGHLPPLSTLPSSALGTVASPTSIGPQMPVANTTVASPSAPVPPSRPGPSFILEEDDELSGGTKLPSGASTINPNKNWRPASQPQPGTQRTLSIHSHRNSSSMGEGTNAPIGPQNAQDDFSIATEVLQCALEGDIVGLMDLVSVRGPEALLLRRHSLAPTALLLRTQRPRLFSQKPLDKNREESPSALKDTSTALFSPRKPAEHSVDAEDAASEGTAAYAPRAKKDGSPSKASKLTAETLKQHDLTGDAGDSEDEDLESIETGATEESDDTTAPPSNINRRASYLPLQRQSTARGLDTGTNNVKETPTPPPVSAAPASRPASSVSNNRPPLASGPTSGSKGPNLVQEAVERMLGQKGRHTSVENSMSSRPQSAESGRSASSPAHEGSIFLPYNLTPEGPYHVAARHNHTDVIDYLNRSKRASKTDGAGGTYASALGINEVLFGRSPLHEAILGGNHRCVYEMIHRYGAAVSYPGCVLVRQSQLPVGEAAWKAYDSNGPVNGIPTSPAGGSIGHNPLMANTSRQRTDPATNSASNNKLSMAGAVPIDVQDPFSILPSAALGEEGGPRRQLHYHQHIIICEDCRRRKGFHEYGKDQLGLLIAKVGSHENGITQQQLGYQGASHTPLGVALPPNSYKQPSLLQIGQSSLPQLSRSNSRAPTPTPMGGSRSRSPAFSNTNTAGNASPIPGIGGTMSGPGITNSSSYYGTSLGDADGSAATGTATLSSDYILHSTDADGGPVLSMASSNEIENEVKRLFGNQMQNSFIANSASDPIVPAFCPMCCVEEQPLHLAASIGDFSMVLVLLETVVTAVCNVLGTKPTPLSSGHQGAVHSASVTSAGAINRLVDSGGVSMDSPLNRWKAFIASRRRSSAAAIKDGRNMRPSSATRAPGVSSPYMDVVRELGLSTPGLAMLATFVNMRRFRDGYTPLHVAAAKGFGDVVDALVSHNGDTAARAVPTVSCMYADSNADPQIATGDTSQWNAGDNFMSFYKQRSYTVPMGALVPPAALSVGSPSLAGAAIASTEVSNASQRPGSGAKTSAPYPHAAVGVRPLDVAKAARKADVANNLTILAGKAKGGAAARLALGLVDEASLLSKGPTGEQDQVGSLAANAIAEKSSRKTATASEMVGGQPKGKGGTATGVFMTAFDADQRQLTPEASYLARLLGAVVRQSTHPDATGPLSEHIYGAKRLSDSQGALPPPTSLAELFERNRIKMMEPPPAVQQRSSVASTITSATTAGMSATGNAINNPPTTTASASANSTLQWGRNTSPSIDRDDVVEAPAATFVPRRATSRLGDVSSPSASVSPATAVDPYVSLSIGHTSILNNSSSLNVVAPNSVTTSGRPPTYTAGRPPAVLPPLSSALSPTAAHLAPLRGGPALGIR